MRARLNQAAAAAWTLRGDEGEEDADGDDHISLVLDESVGQNYEFLRRADSSPRRSSSADRANTGSSDPLLHKGRASGGAAGVMSGLVGSKRTGLLSAPEPPHGGGVASASSSSLSKLELAHENATSSSSYHGHRPSFRVIGVQISHLSRTGQFVFCTFGVFFFLLIYGFLQEYMVIHVFERRLGLFLTLCQFGGYALLAAGHRAIHADTPRRIPLGYYLLLAALQATNQGLTNLSMRWLNYPAKMLFKSSRVVPTMAVGVLYMRKRYPPRDYAVVALLSMGLACFVRADVRVSPAFHPMGILLICLALAVDAAVVNLQEFALRKYDASHDELIFYSYGLGSGFLAAYCLLSAELGEGVAFLHRQGAGPTACLALFCACGYFGVTCVAALTKKFGALASTMTTTARKALTLFLSFFLFPKPATPMHLVGGLLFVLGLTVKAVPGGGGKGTGGGGHKQHHHHRGAPQQQHGGSRGVSRAAIKASHYRALLSSGPVKASAVDSASSLV